MIVCNHVCFFFFKQKTAYEMRISDWSSDVCSSDLVHPAGTGLVLRQVRLDRCPRIIRQPEQRHAMPPIIHAERESGKPIRIKPLIEVWTLAAVVDNIVVGFWRCGSTASCPACIPEIGRAHVGTPVPNAHLVCR